MRLRHFGERTLDSFNQEQGSASTLVNFGLDRRLSAWRLGLEVLNLLDAKDNDIEYFYASRLPGEAPGGIEDLHFHPMEPRTIRASLSYLF